MNHGVTAPSSGSTEKYVHKCAFKAVLCFVCVVVFSFYTQHNQRIMSNLLLLKMKCVLISIFDLWEIYGEKKSQDKVYQEMYVLSAKLKCCSYSLYSFFSVALLSSFSTFLSAPHAGSSSVSAMKAQYLWVTDPNI